MNILKFLWHLLKTNADFSIKTAKKQVKEVIYGILLMIFVIIFFIFVAFLFDAITLFKFHDLVLQDSDTTIFRIFFTKFIEGGVLTCIIGVIYGICHESFSYTKREWIKFKNK